MGSCDPNYPLNNCSFVVGLFCIFIILLPFFCNDIYYQFDENPARAKSTALSLTYCNKYNTMSPIADRINQNGRTRRDLETKWFTTHFLYEQ